MTLKQLVKFAANKENFITLENYLDFTARFIEFFDSGVQATIVSQNEHHYRFYQFRKNGNYNITRPINSNLMFDANNMSCVTNDFLPTFHGAKEISIQDQVSRELIRKSIYTIQQSIGAALDALPAGQSNRARKVNGDLFERLIFLLVKQLGVQCSSGKIKVPVEVNGKVQFTMDYQHDSSLKVVN